VSWATVFRKDLLLIARDRPALLFNGVVPIAVVAIVASTLGGSDGGRLLLPIVNEDRGPVAELLIETLGEHADVIEVDRSGAEQALRTDARAAAALVLPEKLSKRYMGSRPSTLTLLTDPAKRTELETIKAYLLQADREAAAIADPFSEELLVLAEQPVIGKRLSINSFEQNVPGFSVMFVLMGVLFGVAFGIADERQSGTILRLRVAPVSGFEILAGKLLARWLVGVIQMGILFGFGHLVFGVSLGPSLLAFAVVTMAIVFAMTGFSLLVSTFATTREQIIPLGLTVIMLVCALGGCWWPLFMEPLWLQRVALATPTAWAMNGISDLILRERPALELAPVVGILVAYGVACLVLGARRIRL
jgi:ABC-2 type transport system permease protein